MKVRRGLLRVFLISGLICWVERQRRRLWRMIMSFSNSKEMQYNLPKLFFLSHEALEKVIREADVITVASAI